MGALIAALFAGGTLAFFAFRTGAFEPTPPQDDCHKLKDFVAENGDKAGPKGAAAAELSKEYGDDICQLVDQAKEGVADAAHALNEAGVGGALGSAGHGFDTILGKDDAGARFYDPDERAKQLVNAIEAAIKSKADVKLPQGDGSGGLVVFPSAPARNGGTNAIGILSTPFNNYWTPNPLDGKLQHDALYNECLKIEADLYARVVFRVIQRQANMREAMISGGEIVADTNIGWDANTYAYGIVLNGTDKGKKRLSVEEMTAQKLVGSNGLSVPEIAAMGVEEFAASFVALYMKRYQRNTPYVVKRKAQPSVTVKGTKGSTTPPVNTVNVGTTARASTAGLIRKP